MHYCFHFSLLPGDTRDTHCEAEDEQIKECNIMANTTVVLIPQTNGSVIQAGQGVLGAVTLPPGTVQYIQYVGQQVGNPNNQPQTGWMEKLVKVETKTLGAIQILIGLIHIGFGSVSAVLCSWLLTLATLGGYPFWGGLFFIISGTLSVLAEKRVTPCLVRGSIGMNITSAVMALVGIILYLVELSVGPFYYYSYDSKYYWAKAVSTGFAVLLLLFTILEFCIAVSLAHFGCQLTCCSNDPAMVYIPYTVDAAPAEGNCAPPPPLASAPPPAYSTVDSFPKNE
ncbi:membrane-spanning 4-domains subfamily A member 8-like [Lacerta agilis]|uniref:membrane-spanning 4-domains subfamily A member 8-like n=1 Tax=Lacerta agilis TaxID=80427 RepID=UPI0014195545|nr:membrane-spanning 4-domains subfamily A member 8-like [Lacerta agilis]